jgi:hypothetical protein
VFKRVVELSFETKLRGDIENLLTKDVVRPIWSRQLSKATREFAEDEFDWSEFWLVGWASYDSKSARLVGTHLDRLVDKSRSMRSQIVP